MSSQVLPIHRADKNSTNGNGNNNKNEIWFDAFNFAPGQDHNIRWLNRPNQQLVQERYPYDIEKFRITFDVENFQPEQIKIYIQNYKLTITGVYEERSEGRHMQKQFEKSYDIPNNADVEVMACYITPAHMLVVEIPLQQNLQSPGIQGGQLNVNNLMNDNRRLSFSLNKYNTLNNQGLLSSSNNLSSLPPPAQQVRRSSITKTTTTTTGSTPLPPEAAELLRSAETTTGGTQTYTTRVTERRPSNVVINEPASLPPITSTNNQTKTTTILTSADLANLPIEIPPELLATGGTITIQKRKVSVTKTGVDPNAVHSPPVPPTSQNTTQSTSSTMTTANNLPQPMTTERRNSRTISTSNQRRTVTLDDFLQNKSWNPSIIDSPDGKKILLMRLQLKPETTADQLKVTLNGNVLRVEVDAKSSPETGRFMNEHSYRQITLFPTCEVDQLKTELRTDGCLYIQVPIKL
ncbi:unnamed protein product [Adineta ricciae]|uniref:SHSP domain-containing protein n=1 Tax=Adineta ricciae TaxID=249248 RepID=A0A814NBX5_ADIRI|nr:unnamed protein product [Adineta ricciae]